MRPRPWMFWTLFALLFVYEFYAVSTSAPGDTISEIMWSVGDSRLGTMFAFLMGFLMGHFWWPRIEE